MGLGGRSGLGCGLQVGTVERWHVFEGGDGGAGGHGELRLGAGLGPVELCRAPLAPRAGGRGDEDLDFGKGGEITTNRHEDQELSILCLHLLQACLVYINTLMIQEVLSDPATGIDLTAEDLRGLTPLFYSHVNPYGTFKLDMAERLPLAA